MKQNPDDPQKPHPFVKAGIGSYCVSCANPFEARIEIGNFTSIAHGLEVLVGGASNHAPALWPNAVANAPFAAWGWDYYDPAEAKGELRIGHDVWIGSFATLVSKQNLSIGDGAIIGTRSVVTHDIPPFAVVVGSPARVIRYRFDPEIIAALQRIGWWNWPLETIKARAAKFKDINSFVMEFDA